MDGGDWIALGALAVGVGSLFFTARERRTRATEIDLLRRQVETQENAQAALRRADLLPAHGPISGGYPHDEHSIAIYNGGPAIARAIDVWVRKDATGEDVTQRLRAAEGLVANEQTTVRLMVRQKESREGGLTLWAHWRDDTGDREQGLIPLKKHG
jgi:hypothetical protein